MKRVIMIRHAKSDWGDERREDFERPLNKRGQKDAPFMGELLKNADVRPDIILTSPAIRALDTAVAIQKAYKPADVELKKIDAFYPGNIQSFRDTLKKLHNSLETVFLVGHNPAMESFLEDLLTGSFLSVKFPTAGTALIALSVDKWKEMEEAKGELHWFLAPKTARKMFAPEIP